MVALLVISLTGNVAVVGFCLLRRWRQLNSARVSTGGREEEIYEVDEIQLQAAPSMKQNDAYGQCDQPTRQAALNMNQNEAYGQCAQSTPVADLGFFRGG